MHRDALDRPIEVGQVIVHTSRTGNSVGNSVYTDVGVVRFLMPDGSIRWTKLYIPWREGESAHFCPATSIYHTDLYIIVDLTEAQLKEKYSIKGETDDRTTEGGPEAGGLPPVCLG